MHFIGGVTMDLDKLIMEELVQFRKKVIEAVQERHPGIFAVVNKVLADKENILGMQVTENGKVMGEYTFILKGIHISSVESGQLVSEIHHPFLGIIKPYVAIEKGQIERLLADQEFITNMTVSIPRYLPGITIKFMQ
jgi:hypothetical protein